MTNSQTSDTSRDRANKPIEAAARAKPICKNQRVPRRSTNLPIGISPKTVIPPPMTSIALKVSGDSPSSVRTYSVMTGVNSPTAND
ncbi:hypothetical protein D3C74_464980 [compost metagenome]